MPPLWVIGPERGAKLVNYRVRGHFMIVDRLFAAAELRLRPERPRVTCLSGRVWSAWARPRPWPSRRLCCLRPCPHGAVRIGEELSNTDSKITADALAGLLRYYAGLPRPVLQLGPPLPEGLGRPLLAVGYWCLGCGRFPGRGGAPR